MNYNDKFRALLEYKEKGFSVIPVGNDKKPLVGWKQYQDEKVDTDQIRQWHKDYEDINIGIVTGEISGLVVVDVEDGGSIDGYPPTVTAKTGGGGWHLYYKHPGEKVANASRIEELTDIRGDGGYVIAPPSDHPSGGNYEWQAGFDDVEMAEFPIHLFNFSNQGEDQKTDWQNELNREVPEGERNETATKVAGKYLRNLPEDAEQHAWLSFKEWNKSQCKPPLTEAELKNVWESIKSREESGGNNKADSLDNDIAQKDKIVRSITSKEDVTLFHGENMKSYASIDKGNHCEVWPVESSQFRQWISRKFWKETQKAPNSSSINDALNAIQGIAIHDSDEVSLSNRCRLDGGDILYDLANDSWDTVRIDKDNWSVLGKNPAVFQRYSHQDAQVKPVGGGSAEQITDFVNINNENGQLLFLVYLVSCFVPNIPHPIPYVHGPQGSAKSTLSKIVKEIVDPSQIDVTSFPSNQKELVQLLNHHYLLFFDNLSSLTTQQSDTLCRVVTGSGFSKRKLYSDDEDVIFRLKRCIGMNGINLDPGNADLLDRCIIFGLDRIEKEDRQTEEEFWDDFREAKPLILGGIFDTLSGALARIDDVELDSYSRMADFCRWGYAIAESLGYRGEEFLHAYEKNIDSQHEEVLYGDALGQSMLLFSENIPGGWSGTATELLEVLESIAESENVAVEELPGAANALSRKLNNMKTNLAEVGIQVSNSDDTNKRLIYIESDKSESSKDEFIDDF